MLENKQTKATITTNNIDQLYFLERQFAHHCKQIDSWFESQWQLTAPPVYGSVDLRNAGFKIAPIDMNLFPAGFNNLNPSFMSLSIEAAKRAISQLAPEAKNVLVIPESHTRNPFYWQNIRVLQTVLEEAGFNVRFALLDDDLKEAQVIALNDEKQLILEPLLRHEDKLSVSGFTPDMILLNNDLSEGIPEKLQQLQQPIIPPAELGWSQRLKSEHFQYYAEVVDEFAKQVNIDPWLVAPLFRHCGKIDFMQQSGMDCLIHHAEQLFIDIEKKYAEYNIPYQPFLIIKADAGTYGMAVMTVRNVDELRSLNRKQRTRMSTTKGSQPVNRVIIQEGVYSFETWGDAQSVAEPVVYLWGSSVVGGFYRVHKDRGVDENLNAPGMQFEPIAFSHTCNNPCAEVEPDACQNRFYIYGIIAQLSMLAAAREMKDQMQK